MLHFTLDKQHSKPIYLQIRDYFLDEIESGRLSPGQKIPSITDLSMEMGVSKVTVLQALRELNRMGRLFSSAGKGTYVSQFKKLEPDVHRVWGFTETFRDQGYRPASQLIDFILTVANGEVAKALAVIIGTPIFRIMRKRLLNDNPVGFETSYLIESDVPGLDQFDWNTASLYDVLKTNYGLDPVCGSNFIEAVAADEQTAKLLSIKVNVPLLATERIACLANKKPIEFVQAFYRADLMRLKVEMFSENQMNILESKIGEEEK